MMHKPDCRCASCVSVRKAKAIRNARLENLAVKREALQKMQAVYRDNKAVTRLERFGQTMQAYTGIVRSSLTIALYGAPIVVLVACAIKIVFWLLF